MSINIQHFSSLTQAQVDQAYNVIIGMVQESNPTIDFKRGAINDLVLYLSSVLAAANQANIDLVRQSNSLLSISQNPSIADTDTVNAVASNFLTSLGTGTVAKGHIAIVLNQLKSVVIPIGAQFSTSTGLTFTADSAFTARTSQNTVALPTDRLITDLGNGTFVFIIDATSTGVGSTYRIIKNTALSLPSVDSVLVRAYASSDFTGGADPETVTQLLARLQPSVSSRTLSNRPSIQGLIQSLALPTYDNSFTVSTVGFGDQEMQRYYSIFPVAFGGRIDSYVRSTSTPQTVEVFKTAILVAINNIQQGTWQISFGRNDAPGFYEVDRITLPANIDNTNISSYAITSDIRAIDTSVGTTNGTVFFPDINANKAVHAVYSRYQTAAIQFLDTDTPTAGLVINTSTKTYGVQLTVMPNIDVIQDEVADPNTRYPVGDCLIKAPVPCYMSATINLHKTANAAAPSAIDIQTATANAVNTRGFSGQVPVSSISAAIQPLLAAGVAITSIQLNGKIRRPDGTIINLSSSTTLAPASDPANFVSAKTIGFFLKPGDVAVNLQVDSIGS